MIYEQPELADPVKSDHEKGMTMMIISVDHAIAFVVSGVSTWAVPQYLFSWMEFTWWMYLILFIISFTTFIFVSKMLFCFDNS